MIDFDPDWYRERYPDVAISGLSAAEHYQRIGRPLGRAGSGIAGPGDPRSTPARPEPAPPRHDPMQTIGEATLGRIRASGLFDEAWYRDTHGPDLQAADDPLEHYLRRSAGDPAVDPGPLFSTRYYRKANPDARGVPALAHAVNHGLVEGRPVFDPTRINPFLASSSGQRPTPIDDLIPDTRPVKILFWSEGNFFFSDIARYLSAFLTELGYEASCGEVASRRELSSHTLIVTAPHEFCVYGQGREWPASALEAAIYLNTEQWHTTWFSLAYAFIQRSRRALDMNPESAAGLAALGIDTAFLPLLPLPGSPFAVEDGPISSAFARDRDIKALTFPDRFRERPYDLFFVGALNDRRAIALANMAECLAGHDSFLHCARLAGPVRPGDPDAMATSDVVKIARNSKILLNIHQGDSHYFEWHRLFLFGIMEGCVVVTEPCLPNQWVRSGTHYIECEAAEMPDRLDRLLGTPAGREEMERVHANCRRLRTVALDPREFGH